MARKTNISIVKATVTLVSNLVIFLMVIHCEKEVEWNKLLSSKEGHESEGDQTSLFNWIAID